MFSLESIAALRALHGKTVAGVYAIVQRQTGRAYVGSSADIFNRLVKHLRELKGNRHHCAYLQRVWNKDTAEMFSVFILERVDDVERLLEREQFYFGEGYNLFNSLRVAGRPPRLDELPPETQERVKAAVSAASRGHKMPAHVRRILDEANKGRPLSAAHRSKLSASHKGKHQSPELIEKRAAAQRGQKRAPFSPERRTKLLKAAELGRRRRTEMRILNAGYVDC